MKNFHKIIVTSPITALVVTALSMLFSLFDPLLNKWFAYILVFLLALYFIALLSKIIAEKKKRNEWKRQLRFNACFKKIEHDWQITGDGDFFGKYLYEVENIGKEPVHVLPYDDAAWHVMPEKCQFKTEVISTGRGNYKIVGDRGNFYESYFNWNGENRKSYLLFWHHIISPPLIPQDSLTFVKSIHTPKTEATAFTENGALAGIPVNIPTEKATIRYLCPPGHHFILLEKVIIFDMSGKTRPEMGIDVAAPTLNPANNIITWSLSNLKVGFRYVFRYRVVKSTA